MVGGRGGFDGRLIVGMGDDVGLIGCPPKSKTKRWEVDEGSDA
ncbi:MAG: hypothetical protein AAGA15_14065 [Pseudomonadota bacterium]